MTRRRTTTLAAAALALGLGATLTACGGSDSEGEAGGMPGMSSTAPESSSGSSMPADVNDADAEFASNMIVHHREAIAMADLASGRASDPEVLQLAKDIKAAQGPEIETLSGWLTSWGKEPPAEMAGMDHSGSMPGMMSPAEMEEMRGMKGKEFDQMFLTAMIEHHNGAVTMAQTELGAGKNADVKSFAQKVIDDQSAEITKMRELLG
jgi:uncharacterized protein (DUF305 family)